ncbi:MAG TPA: outer membrane beta-barrel protein [Bacteroidales bacterium]|nr:outer membrane beta-barrel protein [Bacteroidales bacterium]
MMKHTVAILILFSGFCLLNGQTTSIGTMTDRDCLTIMNEANRLFQDGLYDKCINNLEGVIKTCILSRSGKVHVLELLAKTYIETDDPGKAETTVNLMLKNFPHYELKEQDNPESYNRLIKKFKIHPRFSIGIRNSLDFMNYKTTEIFYVDDLHYDEPYNKELEGILNDFNWMYYGWAELEFDRDISLNVDLIFKWTNFKREIETPAFNLTFKEQDNYFEIPLYLKKYFHIGKYVLPYVTAGMGWLHMTKATGNATKDYSVDVPSVTTGDINMLESRNRNTFECIAGVGVGYKLRNLRLFIDVRYYSGINSMTNPEKGLSNEMLINDYLYIDNSIKLNQFELGASISYTLKNLVKRIRY